MKATCVDHAEKEGVTDRGQMAEAFYMDIVVALGEAPGQRDSFDSLLDYLEPEDPSEVWHAAIVGFGLALAGDAESRRFIEDAAAAFLLI